MELAALYGPVDVTFSGDDEARGCNLVDYVCDDELTIDLIHQCCRQLMTTNRLIRAKLESLYDKVQGTKFSFESQAALLADDEAVARTCMPTTFRIGFKGLMSSVLRRGFRNHDHHWQWWYLNVSETIFMAFANCGTVHKRMSI